MLKSKMNVVYDWDDLQLKLCEIMGISIDRFRDLKNRWGDNQFNREVEYCDLWHVCLETIIPSSMTNDTTVKMYAITDIDKVCVDYERKNKGWVVPMFRAYNQIMKEIDPNDDGIDVHFSW